MAGFIGWRKYINLCMKIFYFLLFWILPFLSYAQFINCKVQDAETKQPLYYATIYYGKQPAITFSDSAGNFFIRAEILKEKDSIKIEFIGYKTLRFSSNEIEEGKIFHIQKSSNNLQDVIIKNCKEYEEKKIDYEYSIKFGNHYSAAPKARMIFVGKYDNKTKETGFITEIKFHVNTFPLVHIDYSLPLRIRWYSWDEFNQKPLKELTDTNLIVYANKRGWSKISIPDKFLYFDQNGIVIGIEFLYPSNLEKEYFSIADSKEINKWTIKHELSVGMGNCKDNEGFIQFKNSFFINFKSYNQESLKPALNFTIKTCNNN